MNQDMKALIVSVLLYVILAVLAYILISKYFPSEPTIPTSTAVTEKCPRGPRYQRNLFGGCDPNYDQDFWNMDCTCQG